MAGDAEGCMRLYDHGVGTTAPGAVAIGTPATTPPGMAPMPIGTGSIDNVVNISILSNNRCAWKEGETYGKQKYEYSESESNHLLLRVGPFQ